MTGRRQKTAAPALLLVAGALAAGAAPAAGQAEADGWLPWLGCWVPVEAPYQGPLTCILPVDGGVELSTVESDGTVARRVLRADGSDYATSREGCTGVERAAFSTDERRVFVTETLECEGGTERSTRGILAFVEGGQWIEARATTVAGHSVAMVRRYGEATAARVTAAGLEAVVADLERERGLAIETARDVAQGAPDVDDVIEANGSVDTEAVKAWLMEQGRPLQLDAEALIALADAGVPPEVIDVAIAVSFPERFAVGGEVRAVEGDERYGADDRMWRGRGPWLTAYPFFYSPFGYSRYDYFRYGSYWGSPYYYGGQPIVVVVAPRSDGGQVVKGRGYTGGTTTGRAVPRSGTSRAPGAIRTPATRRPAASKGSSSTEARAKPKPKAKPRGGGG
jgi:hypothetical protein